MGGGHHPLEWSVNVARPSDRIEPCHEPDKVHGERTTIHAEDA